MKSIYNELCKKQKDFYEKIKKNVEDFEKTPQDEITRQGFAEENYNLTQDEMREIYQIRIEVDRALTKLKAEGIYPTANEILNGFEV